MKSYNEMAESVFRRSDEYLKNQRKKRKAYAKIAVTAGCIALAVLVGVGVISSDWFNTDGDYEATEPVGSQTEQMTGEKSEASAGSSDKGDSGSATLGSGERDGDLSGAISSAANGVFISAGDKYDSSQSGEAKTVISGYAAGASACYKAPENGECLMTIPLRGAMEEYGDSVLYRVYVSILKDRKPVGEDVQLLKKEYNRLSELGYTVALETYTGSGGDRWYFTLHATAAQLEDFPASKAYGYTLFLYDEVVN